ncbi:T3SS (YopN, CesT) and YbjN peptide-binding chaperone 1 [Nocardioides coralli]|uniref:T3SS (YopN, CesT) and YbjN peptide-binding chaperone 1 n=1 Tax=Nocardioides coralli TaxID=2872154 RepID=UPI001CA3F650|nr:YbjN domain-containing protein [Nocardioides coralli]QZY29683.1 YbjN domain-containing protein [Nocardioides coralli]
MNLTKSRSNVRSILESNGMTWHETGDDLVLRFASALVTISFREWGSQSLVELRSKVLRGISATSEDVLRTVNELNCEEVFGRWVYYADEALLTLEYDMLGDHLQEPELMAAFTSIAQIADHYDDVLRSSLGGHRGID